MPTASSATSGGHEGHLEKFQDLLRELFQFDCADLDFGIYRIMNHKREVVERFIAEDLPKAVDEELSSGLLARQALAQAKLEEARQVVLDRLGEDAIDGKGEIAHPALAGTPVAREYLDARERAGASRSREAVEADVYNHLTAFFSRYYEDGDFVSRRRYSRKQRYAIPYNGEEVYLHWANADQYYVKTGEHFRNYDWKAPNGVSVRFRVEAADVEQNNVKGESRFFLPRMARIEWDEERRAVILPFEYRPLTAQEKRSYGGTDQQDRIIAASLEALPERLGADALAALGRERPTVDKDEPVSHLEHHLRRYARRNDSDFFIHKDLRVFLKRELDFYLKNEVLNLDDLAAAGEFVGESWFQVLQLIRAVGGQIIDFLAQIEGFQRTLWEKRKFVIETNWCVTLRCVPSEFYAEISGNDAQWAEWRALGTVGDEPETLFDSCETRDERVAFLRGNPTLMLDTSHFGQDFSDRLLAAFDDVDGMTDGVLFHSENWQALRAMHERYSGSIDAVYIDPPYNTDASAILYKNGYKDSSWLCLMENGLGEARSLMARDGVLCCAIDDEEAWRLRGLMRSMFEKELGVVAVRSNPAGRKSRGQFSPAHEYAFFVGVTHQSTPGVLGKTQKELARYPLEDAKGRYAWNNLVRHGSGDRRSDRPKMFFPIYVDHEDRLRVPMLEWDRAANEYRILESPGATEVAVWPTRRDESGDVVEKRWHRGPERVASQPDEYRVRRVGDSGCVEVDFKIRMDPGSLPKTWWGETRYASANLGAKALKRLFGERNFDFAKAVDLVSDCLRASKCEGSSTALDFFAGSGTTAHAVIGLNREDGGGRRFILVEMGEYFDTVLLPRIKKVVFSPEWENGKPACEATAEEAQRSPRIVKYLRLESYEDALDSIRFDDAAGQRMLEEDLEGYFLKYMLQWETKDSETLLNPAALVRPFSYRLRVRANGAVKERTADVAETFNYLLGLHVRTRRVYVDGERRYLVFRGETREAPGRTATVIWRETEGWVEDDLARDRDFIAAEGMAEGADALYVNGASSVPGARPIEPLFKSRMFAGVSDA